MTTLFIDERGSKTERSMHRWDWQPSDSNLDVWVQSRVTCEPCRTGRCRAILMPPGPFPLKQPAIKRPVLSFWVWGGTLSCPHLEDPVNEPAWPSRSYGHLGRSIRAVCRHVWMHLNTFLHTSTLTNLLLSPKWPLWSHHTLCDTDCSC